MKKKWMVLAVMSSLSAPVFAEGYAQISGGVTNWEFSCDDVEGFSCDDTDTGFKLLGGWKFHKNFAVELAYLNFGAATESLDGEELAQVSSEGVAANMVAHWDFQSNLFLRVWLGAAYLRTEAEVQDLGQTFDFSESDVAPIFGAGLGYSFSDRFAVELAYDRTESQIFDVNLDNSMTSLGFRFKF